jgi:hypothetical protein
MTPANAPLRGAVTVKSPSKRLLGPNTEMTTSPAVLPGKTSNPAAFAVVNEMNKNPTFAANTLLGFSRGGKSGPITTIWGDPGKGLKEE